MKTLLKVLTPTISTIGIASIAITSCGKWTEITEEDFVSQLKEIDKKTSKYTQSQWEASTFSLSSSSGWWLNSQPSKKHSFKNTCIKCFGKEEASSLIPYIYFEDEEFPLSGFNCAQSVYQNSNIWKMAFDQSKLIGCSLSFKESSDYYLVVMSYEKENIEGSIKLRKSDGVIMSGKSFLLDYGVTLFVELNSFEIGK